jgi:DNA polymerase-3 subunit beta
MRFTSSISEFQKAITKVMPAIPPKSTLPILEHLNFRLFGNILEIIATDQELTILSSLNVVGLEEGAVLVPARKLGEMIKALSTATKGDIEFIAGSEFDIQIRTNFGNKKSGSYKMKGLDPEHYLYLPELFESQKPNPEEIVPGETNKVALFDKTDMINIAVKTAFAVSTDDYRPAMTGVLFQFRETFMNSVATDSFRLVKVTVNNEYSSYPTNLDIILPVKAIDQLTKIDDDVIFSVIENNGKITHARFDIANMVIITRILDEKFPPYEAVIPQSNDVGALVDRNEFLSAVKRIGIFSSPISKLVKLKLTSDSSLLISAEDEDTGTSANETISADYQGEDFEIGFNFKFLEESISHISVEDGEFLKISLSEPSRPALLFGANQEQKLLMLLMPLRVS